jgi:hypothetical protein
MSFVEGEQDAAGAPGQPFETQGARYGIQVVRPQRGVQERLTEPYLMPPVAGRNGSTERSAPAITLTPLGGMMPGPLAIAPAVPHGNVGAFPTSDDGAFGSGVIDSWPEGAPVPVTG